MRQAWTTGRDCSTAVHVVRRATLKIQNEPEIWAGVEGMGLGDNLLCVRWSLGDFFEKYIELAD